MTEDQSAHATTHAEKKKRKRERSWEGLKTTRGLLCLLVDEPGAVHFTSRRPMIVLQMVIRKLLSFLAHTNDETHRAGSRFIIRCLSAVSSWTLQSVVSGGLGKFHLGKTKPTSGQGTTGLLANR